MFWFLKERTVDWRSFHQPLSDEACTHCSKTKVMKCVHSVVLSKINACVSERKAVCSVKRKVETFMQWSDKSSGFTQVQGLESFKSTLTRLFMQRIIPIVYRQIKPRALGVVLSTSKSRTVRSDAEEREAEERPAWKYKNVTAWTKNVMFLWDFGRLTSTIYLVKNVGRTQPEDKNV